MSVTDCVWLGSALGALPLAAGRFFAQKVLSSGRAPGSTKQPLAGERAQEGA